MTGMDVAAASADDRGGRDAQVRAAGAVLWRNGANGPEIALVHRPRYDDWSLPKGKLEHGESMTAAAVREVEEETGFRARLGGRLGDVRYEVPEGRKLVRYWSAQALDGAFAPNAETDELRWVDTAKAGLLTYRRDREVVDRFATQGVPSSVLLLVRHAKAGRRSKWTGDDELRPLSGAGRVQARKLAGLLELFGSDRAYSAPPVRCQQTIAPLAEGRSWGVGPGVDPPVEEPLLGEDGYLRDPAAGLARLRELAREPGVTVLCSQGGVIPDMVETLAREAGMQADELGDGDRIPSRKASTWALGFRDGDLQFADYYPDPDS
jgi:8-oxo-dGTP pyrophosphatase MutT (NUDIX family)/phosphohistidine phosphatase SixA